MSSKSPPERLYYADIYTGSSIVKFSSSSLDSILVIVSTFIIQAQTISVYSYRYNPYTNNPYYAIHQKALEKSPMCVNFRRRSNFLRQFATKTGQVNHHW